MACPRRVGPIETQKTHNTLTARQAFSATLDIAPGPRPKSACRVAPASMTLGYGTRLTVSYNRREGPGPYGPGPPPVDQPLWVLKMIVECGRCPRWNSASRAATSSSPR